MPRLITVSNRLPISLVKEGESYQYQSSVGGLATGLDAFRHNYNMLWVGWPGIEVTDEGERQQVREMLEHDSIVPVFVSAADIEDYYEGFSNKTIWPLFHYFKQYTEYNLHTWEVYQQVNRQFCDAIVKIAQPNDIFWVHDYQLLLLPAMLRANYPDTTIGFFLHIPFPSHEMFRTLPWRREILEGLLGSDLIGFHTFDYAHHFLNSATRVLKIEHTLGRINLGERIVDADVFPMGIDYDKFSGAIFDRATIREVINLRNQFGNNKLILSIDRLDYTKGILQRLDAFERFLEIHPDYKGQVSLIMVVVPSRANVEQYQLLKEQIDQAVGRINSKYSTMEWNAIYYYYRSLPFETMAALYYTSDIALITPLRDGMNLIAKEYVAAKSDKLGVLILSEMAGAARELSEAIIINPNDVENMADAIQQALHMPEEERVARFTAMQKKLQRYNVVRWAELFMKRLKETKTSAEERKRKFWSDDYQQKLIEAYKQAQSRLFFLDYDGTLIGFANEPQKAMPDEALLGIVRTLTAQQGTAVVIISGRDKSNLQRWFGNLHTGMIAEHGVWMKKNEQDWQMIAELRDDWIPDVREVMDWFVDRTPGSFVEEKQFSLVWHYRNTDTELGKTRSRELMEMLLTRIANMNLQVLEGNKVVEVRNAEVNKGKAIQQWIEGQHWDFILAIGDDMTDEDIFRTLQDHSQAFTIKVGFTDTAANYNIRSHIEVRRLLQAIVSM